MTTVQVSPLRIRDRESKPVPDFVVIDDTTTQVHNVPRPLTRPPSPSLNGSFDGEVWERFQIIGLNNPSLTGLDHAIPTVMKVSASDPALTIHQQRYQAGTTSEEAWNDRLKHPERPGQRGDNMLSPYVTYRSSLMEEPLGDLWTGISINGFLYHLDPTGRVIAMAGFYVDPGVLPAVDGSTSHWHGDFGGPGSDDGAPLLVWKFPQDLWIREDPREDDPIAQGVYVTDTGNNRVTITKHVERTTTNPIGTKTRTFIDGLDHPVSLDVDLAKGIMYITEQWGRKVTQVNLRAPDPNATKQTVVAVPAQPFSLRLSSQGHLSVSEFGSPRNLLDIDPVAKTTRVIRQIVNTQGSLNTKWLWHDCDRYGTNGPVDTCKVVQTGSYQHLSQIRWDGTLPLDSQGRPNDQFAPHRQGSNSIGPVANTSDPIGHYPWAFSFSRFFDGYLTTGFGSTGTRWWTGTMPGDPQRGDFNSTLYNAGRRVNQNVGDEFFPNDPSYWPANGTSAWHFANKPVREDLVRLSTTLFNEVARRGGVGMMTHQNSTDAQCRALKYLYWVNSDMIWQYGFSPAAMDTYGGGGPAPVTFALTTSTIGTSLTITGAGTVSGAGTYPQGTTATLVATPKAGSHFVSWGGDASGTNPTLAVVMDRAKNITATFAPTPAT